MMTAVGSSASIVSYAILLKAPSYKGYGGNLAFSGNADLIGGILKGQ